MPSLPELTKPAEMHYDNEESRRYHRGSRITKIQSEMANRAVDLLKITEDSALVLDIGCGSGLSGKILTQRGHLWVGMDISKDMLGIASEEGDASSLLCCDMGNQLPFRDDAFEYAISISVVQWLFHSFKTEHVPQKRIRVFFKSLYSVIRKAVVIQLYCTDKQLETLKHEASRAGFEGGVVVDGEGTKNCKKFMVLRKERDPSDNKQGVVGKRGKGHDGIQAPSKRRRT